jgi:hypothetical protein
MHFKNILAIGAHPDDLELSCFGFLLKQQRLGSNIIAYIFSPDSLTDNPQTDLRISESLKAFSFIPHAEFKARTINNITYDDYQDIADRIRSFVIEKNIDLVLIHAKDDTMQEHRLLHDITMTALRRLPISIFAYRSPSTISFNSNLIVNIKNEYAIKVKAIRCHESQFDKQYFAYDSILIFNQSWNAKKIGIDFCEEFDILRMVEK